MSLGLVLEGGGMRGAYTCGVLDFFLDEEISFDAIYGVSAGACHACSFLSGQRGRALRTITDYSRNRNYAGLYSLMKTGDFFGAQFIYDEVPNRLLPYDYDAFLRNSTRFYIVVTELETGEAHYIQAKDLRTDLQYVRASSSLPMLSKPVPIADRRYLDGGVADSIPLRRSIEDGNEKNIVVLTRNQDYRKQPSQLYPVAKRYYRRYPAFAEAMHTRHIRYNQALELLEQEEAEGRVLVIRPQKTLSIGRLEKDPDKLRDLYRQGYREAKVMRERILTFLGGVSQVRDYFR